MKKRRMTAEDLLKIKFVESLALSPDETEIALSVKTVAEDKKKYHSHMYMVGVADGDLRQFTFGEVSDSSPVFSPDGKLIAFSSKRGEKKGIFVMPRHGGEAKLLADKDGSFSGFSFSPDSKKILCVFRQYDEVPKSKDGKKEPPVYRHITRKFYKMDNFGFDPKAEGQVWVFDIADGKGTQLTRDTRGKESPTYSPDGKYIAYVSNTQKDPDLDADLLDLFVMPAGGGKARRIATPSGPIASPKFSPDGKFIAYLGHANPNDSWGVTNYHVWKAPVRGGAAVDLTASLDRMCVDETISDMAEAHSGPLLHWSPDGKCLYFVVTDAGSTHLYRVPSSGGKPECLLAGKLHIMGSSLSGKVTKAALIVASHTTTPEVHLLDLKKRGKTHRLTHFNKDFESEIIINKPEELIVRAHDGYPIHGWILRPPEFSPKKKYPSILQVHGGPRVQYGNTFFHEMQFLAAQGYVVYFGNPRGGQGYGEKHADTITNNWGTVDYDDCMAFADYMERHPYIDKRRMGVTGGSYGGYMTNWIVTHTNRFAAAITQRSVVNLESMFGASDIGFLMHREIYGTPQSNHDGYRRMSPLTYVKNVRTPLLISHAEQDLRCPMEQAEQFFIALKMLGRTVELVRWPDEPHGLSRCGRPDRRVARLTWFKTWFDRYLKGKRT